ncbi:D-xylose-proton symporter [Synechococcus sp. MIT S9509]|nr:D-xylose-proton symporter [Synechococcus sp. MIT S9504]KZR92717.1 D-xylose-proton symporter [Synechococcus sp. MIT S9509]
MAMAALSILWPLISAALGGFLLGYAEVIVNGAADPLRVSLGLTPAQLGLVVAADPIGAVLTGLFSTRLTASIGRLPGMQLAALAFMGSFIGSALSSAMPSLFLWRLLGGIGIGLASVVVPAYLTEIAPASMRGRIGSVMYCSIGLGILLALVYEALLALAVPGAEPVQRLGSMELWRWMLFSGALPALLYLLLLPRVPESPRVLVLVREGRLEQARRVFSVCGASDPHRLVQQVQNSLAVKVKGSQQTDAIGLWQVLALPVVWSGIVQACFQQFNGINAVFY